MLTWANDKELFQIMRKNLYSAVIGDIMDKMGHFNQFLPPYIHPLRDDMVIAGRAMPVLESDCYGEFANGCNPLFDKPFGLMLEALDNLKEDEVYICSGSSHSYALFGELMATRSQILGAAGAVVDGYSRDTKGILERNFPVFSMGNYAQDQGPRGKVVDYRITINFGNVTINPSDIIFGDIDGVVVIPKKIEKEVIRRAYEKATGEKQVAKAIEGGMSCVDSYAKHGIM